MLYTETPNDVLEKYTKDRCDEIKNVYDLLKRDIMQLSTIKDDLKKFELMSHISRLLETVEYEHVDTLDRYLYAYEMNKRLQNKIVKLEKEDGS